ncbi:MAG: hypothetical protein AABM40_01275 [Chloroflexota bacterium]
MIIRPRAMALGLAAVVVVGFVLVTWRLDLFEIRSGTPISSVAAAFDLPPSYPATAGLAMAAR